MDKRSPLARWLGVTLASLTFVVVASGSTRAHIKYVTEGDGSSPEPVQFAIRVLSQPENAVLFGGTGLLGVLAIGLYLWVRPAITDVEVLRETLEGYRDLVPWMLRLSMGLPLVGAGFAGYYFSPALEGGPRLVMIGLGFFLLFGLATRAVAAAGLVAYLVTLALYPRVVLAFEYVPGLFAIILIGGGRPSVDHMLQAVASTEGTYYGQIDPVHRIATVFNGWIEPYARYTATVVRIGLGITFVYLGLVEKLLQPGQTLEAVAKYDLTAIIPVDPGAWVLGAGLAEVALGTLLIVGLFTRPVSAAAFVVFTLTLFGIPDDPVLAHVTMFGLASAAFTMGSGPLALDNIVAESPTTTEQPTPGD